MDSRLPAAIEGEDLVVEGVIAGLPQLRTDASRFVLDVSSARAGVLAIPWRGRIRLAWYNREGVEAPGISACERWRLTVRLKRPRGLLNPGGADTERSALERGIDATGYVRENAELQFLGTAPYCIHAAREWIAGEISRHVSNERDAALLRSFAVGDTRGLTQRDWEVARANGISHLIAISGFHVGVAALGGVGWIWLVYRCFPNLGRHLPRVQAQAAGALAVAWLYSGLAGFGLPTVRTLLMIAVVTCCRCLRRKASGPQSLAMALIAILVFDPLSVLSPGFWLSFGGVAFLMLGLKVEETGIRGFLRELTLGQWVMTLALLPMAMWFFGEASLVGALSNLVAVPFVSFVIVPLALISVCLLVVGPWLAPYALQLATALTHGQWWLFEQLAAWPGAHWYLPVFSPWVLAMAMFGACCLVAPRGLPLRWCGALMFLPLIWPPIERPPRGAFEAWMLDVGQGLAVLITTREHTLLFDAGARFPSEFDLGQAAVLPSIRALGSGRLDSIVVSHADNDHAGGVPAVRMAFPEAALRAGEPERMGMPARPCEAGSHWSWDGVAFRFLHPVAGTSGRGNDRSCVLAIETASGRLLLTGDISTRAEAPLALDLPEGAPWVLQVPHHGSRTSSGVPFLKAMAPMLGLVSAGWKNRFGHPHPKIAERYADLGIPLLNTADEGAIRVLFPADEPPRVTHRARRERRPYWRETSDPVAP